MRTCVCEAFYACTPSRLYNAPRVPHFSAFVAALLFVLSGTKFHYTTHGWTLLSAVIERVSGQPFLDYLHSHIISPLGMDSTGPEQHEPLTYNRARYILLDT